MTYTLDKNTLMLIADRSETGIVLLDDNLSTACEMNEAARRALPENKVLAEKECRRIAATVISCLLNKRKKFNFSSKYAALRHL